MPAAHHNLNFARWLERLGIKSASFPDIPQRALPTILVADHTSLTNPMLRVAGVVGCAQSGVAAASFCAVIGFAPCPMRVLVKASAGVQTQVAMQIVPVGLAPPLTGTTPLPAQFFSDPLQSNAVQQSTWLQGSAAAALAATFPRLHFAGGGVNPVDSGDLFIPQGWAIVLIIDSAAGSNTITPWWWIRFYELADDPAQ